MEQSVVHSPQRSLINCLKEVWAVSGGPDLLGQTRHDPKKKYKGELKRIIVQRQYPSLCRTAHMNGMIDTMMHADWSRLYLLSTGPSHVSLLSNLQVPMLSLIHY